MTTYTYRIVAQFTVTATTLREAEERMVYARKRLEYTLNNVEVELVDEEPAGKD